MTEMEPNKTPIYSGFPQGTTDPFVYMKKGRVQGSNRGFFQLPKIFSHVQCDCNKSNFHTESKPHLAVKSQDVFN